jgi:non-homologous end joining protein Ku
MKVNLDLEQLNRIFSRRGEKVVLVMPEGEPMVLVPLTEYEQSRKSDSLVAKIPNKDIKNQPKQAQVFKNSQPTNQDGLEAIDPPQGALMDDDQYFPEPI